MLRSIKTLTIVSMLLVTMGLTGCSTLSTAYDSTVTSVSDLFKSDKDKEEKKWFVENRWLPAVNAVREKYNYDEWFFLEIANDVRNIKNQLIDKIKSL